MLYVTVIFSCSLILHYSYRERRNYSEACGNVLTEVVAKLQSTYSHCVELVNAAVCLVLYGLLQLTQLQDADSGMEKQDVFHQLSFCLKNWISKNLSVSASLNPNLTRAKEEVKVYAICMYYNTVVSLIKFLFFPCAFVSFNCSPIAMIIVCIYAVCMPLCVSCVG